MPKIAISVGVEFWPVVCCRLVDDSESGVDECNDPIHEITEGELYLINETREKFNLLQRLLAKKVSEDNFWQIDELFKG